MTDRAFEELVAPHRDELRLHCYRMLGSSHDGDDMVQETLVRAWRAKDSLDDPRSARPWLYRIATNVCLDEIARRPKRALPMSAAPASDPAMPPAPPAERTWVEPCPSAWLSGSSGDPSARIELRESVALAFVAALQLLTAPQRAVLLLRDVVGLTAEEAAAALEMTIPAANSALHRARVAVEERPVVHGEDVDAALLARYVKAWEAADVEAIVALLHDEVTASMPPSPTWFAGRAAFETFLRRVILPRLLEEPAKLVRRDANGQAAFGFYRQQLGAFRLEALHLVAARGGQFVSIDHCMMPEVFDAFALSRVLDNR
jgi:RNA polymerase sigma-70 factor (ECF subfamily)